METPASIQKNKGIASPTSKSKSLSLRLVLYLLGMLLVMGLLTLLMSSLVSSWNSEKELQRKMTEYEKFLPSVLASALWDMNTNTLVSIADALVQNEFVTLFSIRDSFGEEIYFYKKQGENSAQVRVLEINFDHRAVGSVTVGLGVMYFENLSLGVYTLFISVFVIMMVLLSVGSGLVIQTVLTRPFESLGRIIKAYEPGKQDAFSGFTEYREIQPLFNRLKEMGETISFQVYELQESESKFRTVLETSPVPLAVSDSSGKIEHLNKAFEALFGYTQEEIPDIEHWSELSYQEESGPRAGLNPWEQGIRNSLKTGEPFQSIEVTLKAKNHTRKVVELNHVVIGNLGITSFMDLSARKLDEEALKKAMRELEEKNAEMERYIYTVSHDLKSPMVTIKGYAGYVEKSLEGKGFEGAMKDLERIQRAADKATSLLEDLLELSRVGRKIVNFTTFEMKGLIQDVLEAFNPKLNEIGAVVKIEGSWPLVMGERSRLGEIWQNFVENAIKYRAQGRTPELIFECREMKNSWQFSLKDNGIGLDPSYLGKIFEIFEKLNPKTEGSGIGLAIVKRIVEYHQGQVWAKSEGLNQGTVIFFTLPKIKEPLV